MKKVVSLLLILAMVFSLSSCLAVFEAIGEAANSTYEDPLFETNANGEEDGGSQGINAEFKAAMDNYEKFMDEYVSFMKEYKNNPSDLSLLSRYTDYMNQYAKLLNDFSSWGEEDLNSEEAIYYLEVSARVSKKLLEVQS